VGEAGFVWGSAHREGADNRASREGDEHKEYDEADLHVSR
jgi:hypothetical protein